jgi:hypothetical protein
MPSSTPIPQALSFVDFCNRKSLGFMHVNIRSLLPKFVLFIALAHSANLDVLVVSESWLRKATKNPESCNLLQRKPAEIRHTIQFCAQTI